MSPPAERHRGSGRQHGYCEAGLDLQTRGHWPHPHRQIPYATTGHIVAATGQAS